MADAVTSSFVREHMQPEQQEGPMEEVAQTQQHSSICQDSGTMLNTSICTDQLVSLSGVPEIGVEIPARLGATPPIDEGIHSTAVAATTDSDPQAVIRCSFAH